MKLIKNKLIVFVRNYRSVKISLVISTLILLSVFTTLITSTVFADGGFIPFDNFSAYEPGQKAIVAWNGEEEILILSVDVYGSEDDKVLHVVPLPSMPTVKLGNITSFEKINQLIDERGTSNDGGEGEGESESGFEIEFHEKIGHHDITVIKVNNTIEFKNWVTNFLKNKGVGNVSFPIGIDDVIEHYIDQNINHFVFDVIEINQTEKSVDPIIYRFNCDYLFYPLVISSLIEGNTEINLVTLTPDNLPINFEDIEKVGFNRNFGFKISHAELLEISPEIAELIPTGAYLSYHEDTFPLNELDTDIKMEIMDNIDWMFTTDKYIDETLFYDCNGDDIEDIILSSDNKIYAINGKNGILIWQFDAGIDSGNFRYLQLFDIDSDNDMEILGYLGDRNTPKIFAINSTYGNLIWECKLRKNEDYYYAISPPQIEDIDSDGNFEILLFSGNNIFYIINIEDGSELWNFTVNPPGEYLENIRNFKMINPNLDSNQEIIMVTNKEVYYLNGKDGVLIWNMDISSIYYSTLSNKLEESIFDFNLDGWPEILLPSSNGLKLINCEDGSLVWNFQTNNDRSRITYQADYVFYDIDANGIIEIFYFYGDAIYAINAMDGSKLWYITDLQTSDGYGARTFEFHDVDIDGILEIILNLGNNIYVINAENGTILWHRNINYEFKYSSISRPLINDVDQDGNVEIVYSYESKLFAVDGKEGTILWEFVSNKNIYLKSGLEDFDDDGNLEIIIYSHYKMYMINCEDGTESWQFFVGEYKYLIYKGSEDIESDGKFEIIIYDNTKMYVLAPRTGNVIWEFTTGFSIDFYYTFNHNSAQKDNILIFSYDKIYSVDCRKLLLAFNIYPNSVGPGDTVSIFIYTSYHETLISEVEFKLTDYRLNGTFSPIIESYPSIYVITYCVPNTTQDLINISIDASHQDYFGASGFVQIHIIQDAPEPEKELLTITVKASPNSLRPGESSVIIFNVTCGNKLITTNLNFSLFENNFNGTFSSIIRYGNNHFMFTYTVPNTNSSSIPIFILASHEDYYDSIGIIELNIISESSNIENESSEKNIISENDKLDTTITPYPSQLKPGMETVIMIYITNGEIPVNSAKIQPFDNGIGGRFSEIIEHGSGRYSCTYNLPDSLPESITSVVLFFHVSHENYTGSFSIVELSVIRHKKINEGLEEESLSLVIFTHPDQIYPGESATIIIHVTDKTNTIPISEVRLEMSDNHSGGSFMLMKKFDDGRFVYEYTVPDVNLTTIEISAIAHYNGEEQTRGQIELELIQDDNKGKNDSSNNEMSDNKFSILYFSMIFLIFIIGILIGVFGILIYTIVSKKKPQKSKNSNKKTNIKQNGKSKL